MSVGFLVLLGLLMALVAIAFHRHKDPAPVLRRVIEQGAQLVPRMICALIAAGFIAAVLPAEAISRHMGPDAGLLALPVAAAAGLLVPAGPVISFAIAAVFAKAGASTAALMTFITSWSLFGSHRILIYELPLLGPSFFRLRVLSVLVVPFLAGGFAMLVGLLSDFGTAAPMAAP